jgi:hypothetical protein
MSLAPVNPQVAECDSVREQLANMRLDMEANAVNTTTTFTAAGFAESVDLQGAYMVNPLRCPTTTWTMSSSNLNNSEIDFC